MSEFFTHCIYAVLMIHFIQATTMEGMIFGFVRKAFYHFPIWIKKPLYECLICMSPWYAVLCWFILGHALEYHLVHFILIVGGLNTIIVTIIGDHELSRDI